MNAVPNTNPDQKPDRARTPVQTRVRPATHTGSRYAQWYGSKERPAPIPARAAMTVRRGRLTLPPDHVRRCAGRVPGASNVRHRAERGMRAPRAGGSARRIRVWTRQESGPFGPTPSPPAAEIGAVVYWAPDSRSCPTPRSSTDLREPRRTRVR